MYNIFEKENIPSKNLEERDWAAYFKVAHPKFRCPNAASFDNSFYQSAYDLLVKEECSEKFLPVIVIYAEKMVTEFFFMGAAVTRAGKYYKLNTFTAVLSSNFNECLKGFIERCISVCQQKYKVSVKFLIFDVDDSEEIAFIREDSESLLKCISLRRYLNCIKTKGLFVSDPTESEEKVVQFNAFIRDFETCLTKKNMTLADASHIILEGVVNKALTLQQGWSETLKKYVSTLMIGSSYLNPSYKLELQNCYNIEPFEDASYLLLDFLNLAVPGKFHETIAEYKLDANIFDYCKRKNITDPVKYWKATMSSHPELAKFVLDLLAIPACPPKFDLKTLCRLHKSVLDKTVARIEYHFKGAMLLRQ